MNKSKNQLALRKRNELITKQQDLQQGVEWLVLDTSMSMTAGVPNTTKTRLQCANEVLNGYGPHIHVCTFDSTVSLFKGPRTLSTGGSTSMHLGLAAIQPYRPSYVLIISDGDVDNQDLTKLEAQLVSELAIIETLYIGPDDPRAEAFMRELATIGCGRYRRYDMTKSQTLQLEQVVRSLLPAPSKSIEV